MSEHFNRLTPAEAERLAILSEELGEVQQIIGKILRHGYESMHPDGGPTNRQLLELELGHVEHAIFRLHEAGDTDPLEVLRAVEMKAERIGRYLHHQTDEAERAAGASTPTEEPR